jgi:hypothetical protein
MHPTIINHRPASRMSTGAMHRPQRFTLRIDTDTGVELDLLVIADGKIGLGEAKKGSRLDDTAKKEEQRLRNLKRLCHVVHADFVVFATASDDWSTTTKGRIASVFAPAESPEVRYLRTCSRQ